MRVISGTAKGSILYSLEGNNTRPTLDRVKEALFNIIQTDMQDAEILDLFSGSGALAIEALSRGAKKAVLCDNSKAAIGIIEKNLEKTHLKEKAIVIKDDYKKALHFLKNKFQFDFIFLDPPYAGDFVKKAVEESIALDLLKKDGIIIIETDEEERILKELKNMNVNVYDLRKYGRAKLIFLNRKG
ncbi:MAG: 16S rRNA (guanine(966)-N(2))-methyltransferase RsmD [Clostridia bacterium]|nr:16S rRNA (guanine(966)-N(2))-methyltransferase RsmD [Clostridia bacterium]